MTKREGGALERTEKRMLRWIFGVLLNDEKRYEVIKKTLGEVFGPITDKLREAIIEIVRSCDEKREQKRREENYDGRGQGRRKKRWGGIIQQDMKSLLLMKEHTADREK